MHSSQPSTFYKSSVIWTWGYGIILRNPKPVLLVIVEIMPFSTNIMFMIYVYMLRYILGVIHTCTFMSMVSELLYWWLYNVWLTHWACIFCTLIKAHSKWLIESLWLLCYNFGYRKVRNICHPFCGIFVKSLPVS